MRIEELLDPDNLPEDLHWLATEFRIQPDDPVFAVIAWHWHRVQQGEDALRGATLELKAAIDHRMDQVLGATETVVALQRQLAKVQTALAEQPLALGPRLEADLRQPVEAAASRIEQLTTMIEKLGRTAETILRRAQRRQALASFLIGVTCGSAVVLCCL